MLAIVVLDCALKSEVTARMSNIYPMGQNLICPFWLALESVKIAVDWVDLETFYSILHQRHCAGVKNGSRHERGVQIVNFI